MKVVGSGDPRTLTIRLQPCEFSAWRDELARRLEVLASEQRGLAPVVAGAFVGDPDKSVIVDLSVLLEQARTPVAPNQPRVLVGPTTVLADLIRAVAVDAMERYIDLGRAFCEGRVTPAPDELRAALDTATACTATAIGLVRAEIDAHG